MRLRLTFMVTIMLCVLAACSDSTKGVVLERHDARSGIPQSFGCKSTEWLLVIDQGEHVPSRDRFKKKCVSFTTATKYSVGSKYP